jgi:hypothetical protein
MKLDVPYFEICDVPLGIVDNIVNNIQEQDWFINDYRNNVGSMDDTNSIPIHHTPMCASGPPLCASGIYDDLPIHSIRKEPAYDKFFPLIEPVLNILKNHYSYNQYACFLARLKPGGEISMHIDTGNFLTKCHRIHLPLVTDEKVEYIIDGTSYFWRKGTLFEFNNTLLHGVKNNSSIYRIHLVINLYNV